MVIPTDVSFSFGVLLWLFKAGADLTCLLLVNLLPSALWWLWDVTWECREVHAQRVTLAEWIIGDGEVLENKSSSPIPISHSNPWCLETSHTQQRIHQHFCVWKSSFLSLLHFVLFFPFFLGHFPLYCYSNHECFWCCDIWDLADPVETAPSGSATCQRWQSLCTLLAQPVTSCD